MEPQTDGLGSAEALGHAESDEALGTAESTGLDGFHEFGGPDEPDEPAAPTGPDGFYEPVEPGEVDESGEPDGQRRATGEPRVDAALARLDELAGRPVTEHRAIFEDVHRRLRDVLGELDTHDPSPSEDARGAQRRAGR